MKTKVAALTVVAGLILAAGSAMAHHSFAAEFDANQPINLKGTVTKIEWMNPHTFFYIDVSEPNGSTINWGLGNGQPERVDARRLDTQHPEDRRRRHGRRQPREGQIAHRQRQSRHARRDGQAPVCGVEPERNSVNGFRQKFKPRRNDVRNRQRGAFVAAMVAVLLAAFWGVRVQPAQAPPAGQPAGGPGGRGPSGPPNRRRASPTARRISDASPGEKGVWNVPYITNMGERVVEADGTTVIERRGAQGRGARGGRGEAPLGGGEGGPAAAVPAPRRSRRCRSSRGRPPSTTTTRRTSRSTTQKGTVCRRAARA